MATYFEIEEALAKLREQRESVKGKETPYRVEFRYPHGCKHYQYFCTLEDAQTAEDYQCQYTIYGNGCINTPTSKQIQTRGPRNGWRPLRKD